MIGQKFKKPLADYADYSAAAGWCNENGTMIVDHGEYYEVVTVPPPPPPIPEQQIVEIKSRLTEIDLESVRPFRAIAAGEVTEADTAKLRALTSETSALRQQLADLAAQQAC